MAAHKWIPESNIQTNFVYLRQKFVFNLWILLFNLSSSKKIKKISGWNCIGRVAFCGRSL